MGRACYADHQFRPQPCQEVAMPLDVDNGLRQALTGLAGIAKVRNRLLVQPTLQSKADAGRSVTLRQRRGDRAGCALTIRPAIRRQLSPSADGRPYSRPTCSVGRSLSRGVRWARAGRSNRSLELGTPSTDNRAQRCRGGVQSLAGEVPTSRCPRAKILPRAPRGCQQNLIYKVAERRPLPPDQSCGLARGEPSPCAFLVRSS